MPNIKEEILDTSINYIVDAIDTITRKIKVFIFSLLKSKKIFILFGIKR